MPTISHSIIYSVSPNTSSKTVQVTIGGQSVTPSTVDVRLVYSGSSTADVAVAGIDQIAQLLNGAGLAMSVSAGGVSLIFATVTEVQYSQSPSSAQLTFSASQQKDYGKSGSVNVTDIFSRSGSQGQRAFTAAANLAVRPGVTVVTPFDSFVCGSVAFSFSANNWQMTVQQLTAADETRKEQVTAAGLLSGNRTGSAPAGA